MAGSSLKKRAVAKLLLAGSILIAVGSPACATKAQSARVFQYTRTLWRVSDGLPEDTIQALAESRQGLLWIGTTGGLARFDGSRIQVYGAGLAQPLSANSIFCLAPDRDGSLWAGTEGGGLLRLRGNNLKVYFNREGLTDGFVRSVFEDDRGRVWVGTDDGLFVVEGERLRRVDQGAEMAPIAVHSITEDRDHRLWVGGSRLIAIEPDDSNRQFSLPGAYSENRVKKILQTADGTVWVGTVGGLQYLRNGRFQTLPGIHATVRTMLQTTDGMLWIGTIGDGLWTFRDGRLTQVSKPGLLPSDTVLSIFEDQQKQVWIGTQAGLVRLNKTPVSLVPLPEGSDPDYETISGDNNGDVWVAAQSLYLIRDGVARRSTYPGVTNLTVRNIYRARDGALWIGTDGGGVYCIRDGKIKHYSAPGDLTNNFIRGFLESHNGDMWIATDEGVVRLGSSGSVKLTEANGLAYFSTRSLFEDHSGAIWIGTDRGLSCWRGKGFEQNTATRALAQEKVWSILQDEGGTLWFGTRDHGLFRYRDGFMQQFTTAQGLPTNSVYQVLQDRRGAFWLTGPNTIASVQGKEMEGNYPPADQPLSVTVYSMPFGADGAQLYGGRQPAGYLAPDDSVWFPTSRGAAHVADVEQTLRPGPRAFIDELVEDGRTVPIENKLHVPAHIARLSFGFTAIFLRSQEGVRFRYKLENFDHAWNLPGSNHIATYTNLPAGRYRFRVVAFNTSRPGDLSEADLAFVKLPFFYQRWWFYLLCTLIIAAVAWSIYQFRVRQIRTRFSAVLQERSRLAREMHDTVIQGCTGISALLEAVASVGDENRAVKNELLDYARTQIRATIDEARQAVWNMRHEQEKDVDVIEALRNVATQTMREFGNVVTLEHNVERLEIGASAGHEILMTVREAVYNSVQYSGTNRVELNVSASGEDMAISIEDKGSGFSQGTENRVEEGHYGILGMRERMQRLGGRFELTSAVGAGTRVRLLFRRAEHGAKMERS